MDENRQKMLNENINQDKNKILKDMIELTNVTCGMLHVVILENTEGMIESIFLTAMR